MKIALIFPGWGVPRKIYDLLDTGDYEKIFIEPGNEKLAVEISEQNDCETIIIAWSMGTLSAMKIINDINANKIVLMSPTLKFTNSQPEIVVRKMIRDIKKDKHQVLKMFSEMNFYSKENFEKYYSEYGAYFETDEVKLEDGLKYLLTTDNQDILILSEKEPLILTAEYDNIIKPFDSENAALKFKKSEQVKLKCGHNMIYEKNDEVNKLLRGYIYDRKEQS